MEAIDIFQIFLPVSDNILTLMPVCPHTPIQLKFMHVSQFHTVFYILIRIYYPSYGLLVKTQNSGANELHSVQ